MCVEELVVHPVDHFFNFLEATKPQKHTIPSRSVPQAVPSRRSDKRSYRCAPRWPIPTTTNLPEMFLRTSVVLGALVALASATFEVPSLLMTEETLQALYPLNEAAVAQGKCANSVQFSACQANFYEDLGFTVPLSFRNSSRITKAVQDLLKKTDFQNVINVCSWRQKFYSCMGAIYPTCVNRYSLLGEHDATWSNVMPFIQLWEHLDFLCNAGFDIIQPLWVCNARVEAANQTQIDQCRQTFQNTVNSANWSHICDKNLVPQYAQCVQKIASAGCGPALGWFACEDVRVGYARDCPAIRCDVV
uniref:DUF19 domain-containing protein n=1 Tax=Steinernema glaseri TaxID=37863 RepID=A0A1I7YS78_9BILA